MLGQKEDGQSSETIIGAGVEVEGDFVAQGQVVVEGTVKGSIKTTGDLEVGDEAVVEAEVEANNVSVGGVIKGNVKATGQLELRQSAKVDGNVTTNVLVVAAGAKINGQCQMSGTEAGEVEPTKKSSRKKKEEDEPEEEEL